MTTYPVVRGRDTEFASFYIWRTTSIALAAALLLSYFAFSTPQPARAAALSSIGWTNSYYVDSAMANMNGGNLQTTFSQWGTAEANGDNAAAASHGACTDGEYTIYTIIDFGQPFSTYISTYGTAPNQTWPEAVSIALSYAKSWYNTSYNCFRMHLVLGVNNDVCYNWKSTNNTDPCVGASATALADYVENANSNLAYAGDSWQVDISGGIDAETDGVDPSCGCGFGTYSTTLGFANAYTTEINAYTTRYQLYDFGDASHSCQQDWSCDPTSRVYNIAWNTGYDYPFPESYSTGQNSNWQEVSQYSRSNPIQYRVVLLDANQTYCTNYTCWQDFSNKNGSSIEGGVLAGSAQLPLG